MALLLLLALQCSAADDFVPTPQGDANDSEIVLYEQRSGAKCGVAGVCARCSGAALAAPARNPHCAKTGWAQPILCRATARDSKQIYVHYLELSLLAPRIDGGRTPPVHLFYTNTTLTTGAERLSSMGLLLRLNYGRFCPALRGDSRRGGSLPLPPLTVLLTLNASVFGCFVGSDGFGNRNFLALRD